MQTSKILGFDDPPSDNESIDQPMASVQSLSTSHTQPPPPFMYQTQVNPHLYANQTQINPNP